MVQKMKRNLNGEEFKVLCRSLEDMGLLDIRTRLKMENTYINGATFYQASDSPEGRIITYAEDDLKDENGNTYIFEYPYYLYFGELTPGKKLIAVYYGDEYCIIPVDGQTFTLVGAVNSETKIDFSRCKKLPTPIVLRLPKEEARQINDRDTWGLREAVKKYGKFKAGSIVGSIGLSILSVIIIGLIWLFIIGSIADDMSKTTFAIITGVAVVLIIVCIVFSIKFFKDIYLRNVLKMNYIKQVMIVDIEKASLKDDNLSYISFYEWVGDDLKFARLPIGFAQLFLVENTGYGDIAYMLTKEKNKELNLLTTRIFASKDLIEGGSLK